MDRYTRTQESLSELCEAWLEVREREREILQRRRELEMQIRSLINVPPDLEGSYAVVVGPYMIKVASRAEREVDTDLLFEIAYEQGLTKYLPELFFWQAEINREAWRRADERITHLLEAAIKIKFSRPEFYIVKEQEEQEPQEVSVA